ncbi:NAD(P)/FAD-dependent oxidoreductase [Rhodococcus sp. NPDC049939]|uniref:phytoene desaturase family protein n=1 Tax=Rhodococcus sp. NPDC049939 TaxID=3155511 RepID=UPI0033CD12E9
MSKADAVIIGSGPNGVVAAAALADAGWDVVVVEAQPAPGGAVKSAELVPGYTSDLFSAFYPLSTVSPAFRALDLESHGLRWTRAPSALGHARSAADEDAPVIHPEHADTAADLERRQAGDGDAWSALVDLWHDIKEPFLNTLFSPFPPVRGPARLLRQLGTADALRLTRFLLLPARRMAHELFRGEAARLLLLGNAMHADIPSDAPGSGVMGFLLAMLAQDGGYPVPVGGAGELSAAMVRRAESSGVQFYCGDAVTGIEVRSGRAVGVRTASGIHHTAGRAVVADVSAPALYGSLLPADAVPARIRADMEHFEWDTPVVKINYALSHKIPWRSASLCDAGTVHLGADSDGLVHWMADLTTGTIPTTPFLLFGQMTTADPSRSPKGTESAWAYTHLPRGLTDDTSADLLASRVDHVLEAHAPGFSDLMVGRVVQRPSDLEAADANLVSGAVGGGTAQLHQQLIFRPGPGTSRSETPIRGLYLASASAHPGGGVHGVSGLNAARAAIGEHGPRGWVRRRTSSAVTGLLSKGSIP